LTLSPRFCLITRHKAGQGWARFLSTQHGGHGWVSLACRRDTHTHDMLQIRTSRPHQGPLLPKSDVNRRAESCFAHQTSIAKRFKAVAWRRPKWQVAKVCLRPIHPRRLRGLEGKACVCMRLRQLARQPPLAYGMLAGVVPCLSASLAHFLSSCGL
jgi:hypothetical protein